ncbi:MAG: DNA-binding protein [Thermotoga sp.]|nr:MAG: DNA-binding protein [Thermotoga sp.]
MILLPNRSEDWLRQALRDLEHAEESKRSGKHEWACFASHQAAEKAVKALHLFFGQEAWGHVISRLLRDLPESVNVQDDLIEKAKILDNFYIPSRYPNSHPEGAPFEHYGPIHSEEAIKYASEIVEFVRSQMAKSRRSD